MSKYLDSTGLSRVWSKIKAMFAPLASPSLTGTPTAPTAAEGTNTTQIATTAFVKTAVTSAAITVDSALSATSTNPVQNKAINTALGNKANLASPTFTGTPKAPTAATSTNNTQIATTAFVKAAITAAAPTIDTAMSDSSTNAVQNKVIKSYVDGKVSSAYKARGSLSTPQSALLIADNEGCVYNISQAFTTTSDFVEGAGKSYPAGTNIVVVDNSITQGQHLWKWDVLAGMVDLSPYATTSDVNTLLDGHETGLVYLDSTHQGVTTADYEGRGPVSGEFFYCNGQGGNGKMYQYNGSTWSEYTGKKVFIVNDGTDTSIGSNDDYRLTTTIIAYERSEAEWINILTLFPDKEDLNEVSENVSDHASDIVDLYKIKLDRAELRFYYIDSAHTGTSTPSTASSKKGQFFWKTNTNTMMYFDGTSWSTYTGDGVFYIENYGSYIDEDDTIHVPSLKYFDYTENNEWYDLLDVIKKQGSEVNNVVRPTARTGTPATTGHTMGDYYIYKDTIEGNTVLTLYYGSIDGTASAVTSSSKLFLYDNMVYQFISGTGEGTGLQPVGHVESITDSEIDTICV